jgi:mRNA interferase RelE/StbE
LAKKCRIESLKKLKGYAKEPLKYAQKLITHKIGTYRFRIGDYRGIFDIDGENIVI